MGGWDAVVLLLAPIMAEWENRGASTDEAAILLGGHVPESCRTSPDGLNWGGSYGGGAPEPFSDRKHGKRELMRTIYRLAIELPLGAAWFADVVPLASAESGISLAENNAEQLRKRARLENSNPNAFTSGEVSAAVLSASAGPPSILSRGSRRTIRASPSTLTKCSTRCAAPRGSHHATQRPTQRPPVARLLQSSRVRAPRYGGSCPPWRSRRRSSRPTSERRRR